MSETETTASPPPNVFIADDTGVTKWRPSLDGIRVRRVFKGIAVEAFEGERRVVHILSHDGAWHLARLLDAAASPPEAE